MYGNCLTVIGLISDIIGAGILVYDGLKSGFAVIRQHSGSVDDLKWYIYIPIQLSKKIGSKDPQDTEEYVYESVTIKFWGLFFLIVGFILQFLGIVL